MSDPQKDIDFGDVEEAKADNATFCGRCYKQTVDGNIDVTMEEYVKPMQTVRSPQQRSKATDSALIPAEHRGLRMVVGQLE